MLLDDPTVRDLPGTFREFFKSSVRHVKVFERLDDEFTTMVTQAYRLQYLKDVVLARYLDDPVFNTLSDAVRSLYSDILRTLVHSQLFVEEMISIFRPDGNGSPISVDGDPTRRLHASLFLKELALITKQCLEVRPQEVYTHFFNQGLFSVVLSGLSDPTVTTRQAMAEFLSSVMDVDRRMVQSFCLTSHQQHQTSLAHVLVNRLLVETDPGLLQQCVETLKLLLEPETIPMPGVSGLVSEIGCMPMRPMLTPEYEAFLDLFYEECASSLVIPLQRALTTGTLHAEIVVDVAVPILTLSSLDVERAYQMLELLNLMLRAHTRRFRTFLESTLSSAKIVKQDLENTSLSLGVDLSLVLKHFALCDHKHVQLATIRLIRSFCVQPDVTFATYIMRHQVLYAAVYALLLTDSKYNLVNSAVLELLDTISGGSSGTNPSPHKRMLLYHVAGLQRYWQHVDYASDILARFARSSDMDDDLGHGSLGLDMLDAPLDLKSKSCSNMRGLDDSTNPDPLEAAPDVLEPLPSPAMDSKARAEARGANNLHSPSESNVLLEKVDPPPVRLLPLSRYDDDDEDDEDSLLHRNSSSVPPRTSGGNSRLSSWGNNRKLPISTSSFSTKKTLSFKTRKIESSPGGPTSPSAKKLKLSLVEIDATALNS
jgi:hypothetical protein